MSINNKIITDVVIVGAGPVGLMCAYLGQLCGLRTMVLDKSSHPLEIGRADALNARTLQLLEVVGLFDELYPLGKKCNTSSVWENGQFISRQSYWWDELEGCLHKHFLMLGQPFVEKLLDTKLTLLGAAVKRNTTVVDIKLTEQKCLTKLADGQVIESHYVIGADGSRSMVRELFNIPFEIIRPQLIWAVIDGVIETNFPKVPEIIAFQNQTSDVAWIPREGEIDRFYVRMDVKDFSIDDAIAKIHAAVQPHTLSFKKIVWFSRFSVKESVAQNFSLENKIFLAGDACHIHSVNGGQGLNTGLSDAFNLMWKLNMARNFGAPASFLQSYEKERLPVALSVIQASGELVRSTKYSENNTHAQDYVKIVQKRAGNITGMGIRYGNQQFAGTRLFDFEITQNNNQTRMYSLLDYAKFTLLVFSDHKISLNIKVPEFVNIIQINSNKSQTGFQYKTDNSPYKNMAVLVRPDSYIATTTPLDDIETLFTEHQDLCLF